MKTPNHAYFAAANTTGGFYSLFPTLFDVRSCDFDRVYILKGGPGTGKSRFLCAAADAAEEHGMAVERYFCSSDTRSLDAIRIPALHFAMLDGTAPHTVDPVYPGAVEELVNLGMFFDVTRLREHVGDIRALGAQNSVCHRRAARYLSAAGEMRTVGRTLTDGAFSAEKAMSAAKRILRECKPEKEEEITRTVRLVTANSTQGCVHLTTAEEAENAGTVVYVSDRQKTAAAVLASLISAAEWRGVSYVRYADPLFPAETEGVYLPSVDTLYMTDRYGTPRENAEFLNSGRFYAPKVLAGTREKRRFAAKCEASLLEGAYDALRDAGALHDALEAYYIAAMDFPSLNAFEERMIQKLFAPSGNTQKLRK